MRIATASLLLAIAVLAAQPAQAQWDAEDAAKNRERRAAMIQQIDARLAQRWDEAGIAPAAVADDLEFLRRVYLDLTGVIPRVAETRDFLADSREDKRARLIDRLLQSPAFATHMANTWRRFMLPGNVDITQQQNVLGVQNWLRSRFAENLRYDRMVDELLVATGGGNTGPALYYTAMENAPEKVAASTARIFMGIQLDCAQCHPHPFDRWSQQDFWGYAAFFARLEAGPNGGVRDAAEGEVTLPDTDTVVAPIYPGGDAAKTATVGTRRQQLSVWMTARDNPYLPRAAVNRVWSHLFGRGIVEPVDDLSEQNVPSHPELLDELSRYFVRTGFDIRELFRTLALSRAYQTSSRGAEGEPSPDPELFARMMIKSLTAEQLYDSLQRSLAQPSLSAQSSNALLDPRRRAFVARMETGTRSAAEFRSGVPQALTLMNGSEVAAATDANRSAVLAALDAPFLNDQQRVEILFLATLNRPPRGEEASRFLEHVADGASQNQRGRALGDVLWALLNSGEFSLNH